MTESKIVILWHWSDHLRKKGLRKGMSIIVVHPSGLGRTLHTVRQHCRLSICEYWLSLTNTVTEAKIQMTLLILRRGVLSTYCGQRI